MDLPAALSSIGTAIGIVKTVSEISKDYDVSLLKLQMVELRGALADAKGALYDAQDEIRAKDEEIARLRKLLDGVPNYIEQGGFKFKTGADGQPSGSAYCPKCEIVVGKFVCVVAVPDFPDHTMCPVCGRDYSRYETVIGSVRPTWSSTTVRSDFDVFEV